MSIFVQSHCRFNCMIRGHRANSFQPIDINELVEIRARQRTFDGAYRRTALGNFGAALTILRLFDHRFYQRLSSPPLWTSRVFQPLLINQSFAVGILYAVLAGLLFVASFFRARHSRHDFADYDKEQFDSSRPRALKTKGQEGQRIFGRPFKTAGWIVVAVTFLVAAVEVCLMVLVLEL
ncbi:hypothetical protein HWV62_2414 [Athelia sp. TMB]|nr:hypothetical protein HWV62_30611 [Athelia sp. TMB]KAF7977878.1 hypothetical protein HWV62_2414 [Athelia sp. TMB]